jgi:hypothetical protein
MLNAVSYVILLLNVNNMSGNPYYNFFWQSAVEFPAGIVAKWLTDWAGRRSTHTLTFLVASVSCFGLTRIVNSESVTALWSTILHEMLTVAHLVIRYPMTP